MKPKLTKKSKLFLLVLVVFLVGCVTEQVTKEIDKEPKQSEKITETQVQEPKEEEQTCTAECSSDSCFGFEFSSCKLQSDGCKKRINEGKIKGKCNVECLSNSDCNAGYECKDYKCNEKAEDLEMSIDEIIDTFSGLSELQQEEKFKELKNKRIKTSIRADVVDKASLSTQYVAREMYDMLNCKAKAFFPSEEKDNLLNVNLGDIIIFSGELVNYDFGFASCIEFTKSKFIGVEKPQVTWLDLCLNAAKECKISSVYKNDFREGCYNYYSLNSGRLNTSDSSSYSHYINYLKRAFDCE